MSDQPKLLKNIHSIVPDMNGIVSFLFFIIIHFILAVLLSQAMAHCGYCTVCIYIDCETARRAASFIQSSTNNVSK